MKTLGTVYAALKQHMSDFDARYVLKKRADIEWQNILSSPDYVLADDQVSEIDSDLRQYQNGVPLTRIYNTGHFYGLEFVLNEATLDPRPETEMIVDLALMRFNASDHIRILDMGTGSGCLAIALLKQFPNAIALASDYSKKALDIVFENAKLNQVRDRISTIHSDWWSKIDGEFDLIVSNPPYIQTPVIPTLDENVREFDPILALDGGEDGLKAYKEIFLNLNKFLKGKGTALFEIGYDQKNDVMRLAENYGFASCYTHLDFAQWPRVVEITNGDNIEKNIFEA